MSSNTQIGRLLAARFAPFDGTPHSEGRVVFWHDEAGEFSEEVDGIVGPEAETKRCAMLSWFVWSVTHSH